MKNIKITLIAITFVAIGICPPSIYASPIIYSYTGIVTDTSAEVYDSATGYSPSTYNSSVYNGVDVGDTVKGFFSWDSDAIASTVWDNPKHYFLLGTENADANIDLKGLVIDAFASYTIQLTNDGNVSSGGNYDALNIHFGNNSGYSSGSGIYDFTLNFSNYDLGISSPFTSGVLPSEINLDDWSRAKGYALWQQGGDNTTQEFTFDITDVQRTDPVPEPGTMFLLGSGLVGLAGYGRKRRKE